VSRPVLLVESFLADTPAVLGHLRPLIFMPAGLLTSLPAEQIEAILLHEAGAHTPMRLPDQHPAARRGVPVLLSPGRLVDFRDHAR
jgi:hypothetical protein